MRARLYMPARNAMQSGTAKTRTWVMEFAPASARETDPLMGWTSSADTQSQIRLNFDSQEAAEDYATENNITLTIQAPKTRKPVIRQNGYGENFATNRRAAWTH